MPESRALGEIEVYDGLDSNNTDTYALSANQGRVLNEKITNLSNSITSITNEEIDTIII